MRCECVLSGLRARAFGVASAVFRVCEVGVSGLRVYTCSPLRIYVRAFTYVLADVCKCLIR